LNLKKEIETMSKLYVEISSYHVDHGEDSAGETYHVVDAKDHEQAILLAMDRQPTDWPFDESWGTMVEESDEHKGEHFYCGIVGDWTYNITVRKATKKDEVRVGGIEVLKKRLQEWIKETVKPNKTVTEQYGSAWHFHIMAHCLAECRVERMSKDELVDYLYERAQPADELNEDQLAETCLKEISSNVETIIDKVDKFFRRRYPKSIKKGAQKK
jgi:hypothetical protein